MSQPASQQIGLVPHPRELTLSGGSVVLPAGFTLAGQLPDQVRQTLERDIARLGFTPDGARLIRFDLVNEPSLSSEAYRLHVASDITIAAATPVGMFWATRTLLQLIGGGPGTTLPCMQIVDWPEASYRGFMIDAARHPHTMDFHLGMIERLAAHKINHYHIHFSDDEAYTLPSEAYPQLPSTGQHYTAREIGELVRVAEEHCVTIVPEVDLPGHASAITRALPQLCCTDAPRTPARKLCIGNPETRAALQTLLHEIMQWFPGNYLHLGADEVAYPDREACMCTHCGTKMDQLHVTTGAQYFKTFINQMYRIVREAGREMLVWEGFDPAGEPGVPSNVIVCPFDVKHPGRMPADYLQAGHRLLNTSWTPLYVADKIDMTTPEMIARWLPHMFGAGRSPQPFAYWKSTPEHHRDRIIGGQMCSWNIEEKAQNGLLFGDGPGFEDYGRPAPRLPIVAERLWSGADRSAGDLLTRVGEAYW